MDTMASSELTQEQAQLVARSEELVDRFLDAIWIVFSMQSGWNAVCRRIRSVPTGPI
jgi:FMN-dependent NADH-azoreductase